MSHMFLTCWNSSSLWIYTGDTSGPMLLNQPVNDTWSTWAWRFIEQAISSSPKAFQSKSNIYAHMCNQIKLVWNSVVATTFTWEVREHGGCPTSWILGLYKYTEGVETNMWFFSKWKSHPFAGHLYNHFHTFSSEASMRNFLNSCGNNAAKAFVFGSRSRKPALHWWPCENFWSAACYTHINCCCRVVICGGACEYNALPCQEIDLS